MTFDKKFPELFGDADKGFLNPRVFRRPPASLSAVFLSPHSPTTTSEIPGPLEVRSCCGIYPPFFYQAFNRCSRDLYVFREANNIPIPTPPLLFNLSGRLVSDQFLRHHAKKHLAKNTAHFPLQRCRVLAKISVRMALECFKIALTLSPQERRWRNVFKNQTA